MCWGNKWKKSVEFSLENSAAYVSTGVAKAGGAEQQEGPLLSLSMQCAELPPGHRGGSILGGSPLHRSPTCLSSCKALSTPSFAALFWSQQHKRRAYQAEEQGAHTRCLHGPGVRHPRSPRNTPLQWLPRPGSGDHLNGQQFLQCFWRQVPGPTVGPKKSKNRKKISKQSKDKKTARLASLVYLTLTNPTQTKPLWGLSSGLPSTTEQHQAGATVGPMAGLDHSCTGKCATTGEERPPATIIPMSSSSVTSWSQSEMTLQFINGNSSWQ